MKKLMIAAAAAAMVGGAYAACKPGQAADPTFCAQAYDVKINLKTPGAVLSGTITQKDPCGPGQVLGGEAVRKPGSYKIVGLMANCDCVCDNLAAMTGDMIAFWNTSDKLFTNSDAAWTVNFLHAIGKSQKDAEINFTLGITLNNATADSNFARTFTLNGSAFGKFDPNKVIFKSFSGYVAGTVAPVKYPKAVNLGTADAPDWQCPEAGYWTCDDLTAIVVGDEAVAYGSITIKYNSALSSKLAKNGYRAVAAKLPKYVTVPAGWVDEEQ